MPILFKLSYSLVVAILLVLLVILGIRTFYDGPEEPRYPNIGPPPPVPVQNPCLPGERCPELPTLTQEQRKQQREFEQAQREFEKKHQAYEDERADYRRNVFIAAQALGVAAIGAGLALFRRIEAMPLGLLLGGFGVIIFGWAQTAEDFDEIGAAPMFAVVAISLGVVIAAGYRFLGLVRPASNGGER